jgi:hypothetical protein
MREPLDSIADTSIKEMHWLWSPGGGKTTGIEGAIQWRMVNAASNILAIGQKDDTAERWMETRLLPSIRKNPAMKSLIPPEKGMDRHRMRKSTVIFNNGYYLESCGSAESNLQEKSMPMVIMDEAWKIGEHPGRLQQAKQRTHDKWNSLILYAGQAGETHTDPEKDDSFSDLFREWRKTDQRTFCWKCPKCETLQPYKWSSLKWDKSENENGDVDWDETGKTVRMECANAECNHGIYDNVTNRRALAESGEYVAQNKNGLKGHVGFHASSLCYWRIPWLKIVRQFDEAMDAKMRGDTSLLQIFIMQRLAEFWTPSAYEPQADFGVGGYTVEDYEEGQLIDNEEGRSIAVDVQQNDMWYTIGGVASDRLRILNCGNVLGFDEIEKLRVKYNVKKQSVLVDCKYRTNYVLEQCAIYGWTAYRGVFRESYSVRVNDGYIRAPYSELIPVQSGSGKKTRCISFCVNQIKDVLAEMRAGRLGSIEIPDNIDPRYREHLNAEVKRRIVSGRENRETEMWVRIGKRANHMLDNTMALVGYMMVMGLVKLSTKTLQDPHKEDK